jgi:hypothetical protein
MVHEQIWPITTHWNHKSIKSKVMWVTFIHFILFTTQSVGYQSKYNYQQSKNVAQLGRFGGPEKGRWFIVVRHLIS